MDFVDEMTDDPDSFRLGDGRIVSLKIISTRIAFYMLEELAISTDRERNDKMVDFYNREYVYFCECVNTKKEYNELVNRTDEEHFSNIKSVITRFHKLLTVETDRDKIALLQSEKMQQFEQINDTYYHRFTDIKNEYKIKTEDLKEKHRQLHETICNFFKDDQSFLYRHTLEDHFYSPDHYYFMYN